MGQGWGALLDKGMGVVSYELVAEQLPRKLLATVKYCFIDIEFEERDFESGRMHLVKVLIDIRLCYCLITYRTLYEINDCRNEVDVIPTCVRLPRP